MIGADVIFNLDELRKKKGRDFSIMLTQMKIILPLVKELLMSRFLGDELNEGDGVFIQLNAEVAVVVAFIIAANKLGCLVESRTMGYRVVFSMVSIPMRMRERTKTS
jgi:hypothetical protein